MSLLFQSLAGRPPVGLIEGEHRVTVITPGGLLNARLDTLQVFINGDLVTRIDNIENNLSQSVWSIARTISLAGPFTGAVAIDGSQDVTLTVTVPPNALPTSAISGLDTQLAGIESDLLGLVDDIADVQGSLAGKVNVGDTVNSALRLSVARDFAINGVINAAAVSFDGSGNVTLTATINDGALSIAKTSGLQSALNAKIDTTLMGVPLGVATLDADGKVPLVQIPPFFDDVLEFNTFSAFPVTGESGKFYIDLDTGDIFRWSGSIYVNVGVAAAVSTAALKWFTERTLTLSGKATGSVGIDGSQDVTLTVTSIDVTKSDVGLGNVDNTADIDKPVSTAVQTALDLKANRESPTFTGTVTIPTAPLASNNQIAASTAFVASKVADYAPSKTGLGASGSWSIDITGLAARALLLNNSRDFSLEGIVTAVPVGFDGSGNVVLSTTIANGALTIAKTAGLQTALDNKLDANAVGDTVAPLVGGKVPAQYLDVQDSLSEYPALANFPATGVANRLYLDRSNNRLYRWSVDQYVWVSADANTAVTAQTAARWTTARTLTLSGKVDGSASIDGSANVTLNVTGLNGTKADVGLGNVDNTSDLNKPISTATQTALDLKADLASPTFTGTPSTPTAPVATNTTQIASTAFVGLKVADYAPSKTGSGASGTWDIGITGNAVTATRLATARTIDLTGIVTATGVNFDGSSNISLNTAVADGALSIAKTAGLQTALDARLSSALLGVANGVAQLDASGRVPAGQLPSYVDDVIEAANLAALPGTGETGKIYVTLDTNRTYRWSGSAYVEISASPGTTDAVPEGTTNLYFTTARASAAAPVQSVNGLTGAVSIPALTDGDKGDITVSGAGAVWTIDNGAVTLAKLANIATATILGNNTGSAAVPTALTAAQVRTLINVADGATANSPDATLLNRANHTGTQAFSTITGTVPVDQGGTGIVSYTTNNYIRAQSATVLEQRTPAQVLADIGAAAANHTHLASQISNSTGVGQALMTAVNAAAGRTALGLGTAAVENIGTSGATVPRLNGANTWGAVQVFGGAAGAEGGEIGLQSPVTGTNLTGNVAVDIQGNSFRVFGLYSGQTRGFLFDFNGGTPGGINTLWHNGNFDPATKYNTTGGVLTGDVSVVKNTPQLQMLSPSGTTASGKGYRAFANISDANDFGLNIERWTGSAWTNAFRYENFNFIVDGLVTTRVGSVGTQVFQRAMGWNNGVTRWAEVFEFDADLSYYCYDTSGLNPTRRLMLDNAVGGNGLFVGANTLTYGGNLGVAGGAGIAPLDVVTGAGSRILFRQSGGGRASIDSVTLNNSAFAPMEFTASQFDFNTTINSFGPIRRRVTGGGWILKNDSADGLTGRGGLWSDNDATRLVNEAFSAEFTTRADGTAYIGSGAVRVNSPISTFGGQAYNQGRLEVIGGSGGTNGGALVALYLDDAKTVCPIAIGNRSAVIGGAIDWRPVIYSGTGPVDVNTPNLSAGLTVGGNLVWNAGNLLQSGGGDNNAISANPSTAPLHRTWNAANQPQAFSEVIQFTGIGAGHALQLGYFGGQAQNYYIRHFNDQTGWGSGTEVWRQLWHSGNQASVAAGARFGQPMLWNHTNGRVEASDGALFVSDWNSATENGWWQASPGAANAPNGNWHIGVVTRHNPLWITQELWDFTAGARPTRWRRQQLNGTWSAWEGGHPLAESSNFNPSNTSVASAACSVSGAFGGGVVMRDLSNVWSGMWTQGDSTMRFGIGGPSGLTERMRILNAGFIEGIGNAGAQPGFGAVEDSVRRWAWYYEPSSGETRLANYNNSGGYTGDAIRVNRTTFKVDFNGEVVSPSTYSSTGSNAAFVTWDRTGGFTQAWAWYASGNIMRMFHNSTGDRFTIDSAGNGGFVGAANAARFFTGFDSGITNSMSCSNWFRSNGATGWFNATYGVGINAEDSTYVRAYNGTTGGAQFLAADFVITSDVRSKVGIRDLTNRGRLRPVQYLHKDTMKADVGFVAQEVQVLYPELVGMRGDGTLNLSYAKITAVLSEQVNRLEDESVVLKETIVTMRDELDTLKAQMAELIASLKR